MLRAPHQSCRALLLFHQNQKELLTLVPSNIVTSAERMLAPPFLRDQYQICRTSATSPVIQATGTACPLFGRWPVVLPAYMRAPSYSAAESCPQALAPPSLRLLHNPARKDRRRCLQGTRSV